MKGARLFAAFSLPWPRNHGQEVTVRCSATLGTTEFADHAAMVDQAKLGLAAFSGPAATIARDDGIAKLRIAPKRRIGHLPTPNLEP